MFVKERVTFPVFEIFVTLTSGGIGPFLTPFSAYAAFFLAISRFNKSFAYISPIVEDYDKFFIIFLKLVISAEFSVTFWL